MWGPVFPIVAGLAAGAVLGFVGAGGTVVGLPLLLLGGVLAEHAALGTNAAGVAAVAGLLAGWNWYRRRAQWREGCIFAAPGLGGIVLGTRMGLAFPGRHLIAILGVLLFFVAAWMFWLGTRDKPLHAGAPAQDLHALARRALRLVPLGFAVGWVAGFFAIGGGFLIVPALMLGGDLPLALAAPTALIPIALFAALVGGEYALAGQMHVLWVGIMAGAGLAAGAAGIAFAGRTPRHWLQRAFAVLLVAIGAYFVMR